MNIDFSQDPLVIVEELVGPTRVDEWETTKLTTLRPKIQKILTDYLWPEGAHEIGGIDDATQKIIELLGSEVV